MSWWNWNGRVDGVARRARAVGATTLVVMGGGGLGLPHAAAQTPAAASMSVDDLARRAASGGWDTFAAHVVVRRHWLAGEGHATPLSPVTDEYIYERERTGTGWRTRVAVVAASAPTVRGLHGDTVLANDLAITRMEDAEDGSRPRFFRRDGVEIALPSAAKRAQLLAGAPPGIDPGLEGRAIGLGPALRRADGPEWIRTFVMAAADAGRRLTLLTRRFGRRAGWIRGYGQYVRIEGERSEELLVDEQTGVPVEANVAERGALRSHTTFGYERAATGALLRRRVRIERAIPATQPTGGAGARAVTEIEYSQVQLFTKGGR